ncbi:MAG: glycoside hydrolase family 3 C-terminal domain-containing protein, partial [Mobilitalea sp.]
LAQTVTKHGYVETDAQTLALGLKAGVDSFNDPDDIVIAAAKEAIRLGLITEEDLNRSIRNTFSTKLRLGLYDTGDECPYSAIGTDRLNCQENKDICLEVAKKAVILLKNEKQMLPIRNTTKKSIAVVGLLADAWNKDWYSGVPLTQVTPWKALRQEFASADLSFADGIDRIKICVGGQYLAVKEDGGCYLSDALGAEVFEHTDWGDNKHTLRATSIGKFLTAEDENGGILAKKEEVFSWFVQESFSLHGVNQGMKDTTEKFTIEAWNHKVIYLNEAGRLVLSENISTDQIEDDEKTASQAGSIFTFELIKSGIAQAVELAKTADTVIAVIGCHPIISSKEDVDRPNTLLPAEQRKLLQNLKSVNPNVVLVLVTNYPYEVEWEKENLPAILMTASGSQDLGTAIAKAISGEYSPAGRLNMTWYQGNEELPPMREYDIIKGKRTYQYFEGKVIYPFGYGLSYTEFLYQDLQVKQVNDQIEVSMLVKNVGAYDSDEVVQLYVSHLNSRTTQPIKTLKGFHRISIKAGEEMPVLFHVPCNDLRYYDVVTGAMVLEENDYMFQVGASSEDIRLETRVHVAGTIIASRDMTKTIPCDHYDSYENIYLHLGHDKKPCILPKTIVEHQKPKGIAVYNDVSFKSIPRKLMIDVKAEEPGLLIVRYGDRKIAENSLDVMEDFRQMEVLINSFEFELGENRPLQIEIQGKIRIVEFFFQT